jgi:hypothetical protein
VSKGHSLRAEDNAKEIKQLNRSIFRPVITFDKEGKRAAQEAKLQDRFEDQRKAREKVANDLYQSHNQTRGHLGEVGGEADSEELLGGRSRMRTAEQFSTRTEQRKRYQFEANASDDEMEDDLDDGLDEISKMTKKLKALGMAMGDELDHQNRWIDGITGKTDSLDQRLQMNTDRVRCYSTDDVNIHLMFFLCAAQED